MRRRTFLKTAGGAVCSHAWSAMAEPPERIPSRECSRREDDRSVLVKVLGTAQDGGIPHLGCSCPNCERARRSPQHARLIASLAVADLADKTLFLIDATPDIRPQLDIALRIFGPDPPPLRRILAGVVLTHAHIGHYTGLMFFGYEALSTDRLPVFCSTRMADFLAANGPWSQLIRLENIELHPLAPDKEIRLTERISVTPCLVPHRDEFSDTFGFTFAGPRGKLLYIPDIDSWEAWEKPLRMELEEADFALLDGTFFSSGELPGRDMAAIGHPTIEASLELLKDLPEQKKDSVFFTHLNHSNAALDPEGEARKLVEGAGFALASRDQTFFL